MGAAVEAPAPRWSTHVEVLSSKQARLPRASALQRNVGKRRHASWTRPQSVSPSGR